MQHNCKIVGTNLRFYYTQPKVFVKQISDTCSSSRGKEKTSPAIHVPNELKNAVREDKVCCSNMQVLEVKKRPAPCYISIKTQSPFSIAGLFFLNEFFHLRVCLFGGALPSYDTKCCTPDHWSSHMTKYDRGKSGIKMIG